MTTKDCIAVVISAPDLDTATFEQACLARELAEAKVAAAQDIVSDDRYRDALRLLITGMMVLFHQGGAPSIFEGKVMNVGRLIRGWVSSGHGPFGQCQSSPARGVVSDNQADFPYQTLGGVPLVLRSEPHTESPANEVYSWEASQGWGKLYRSVPR